MLLGLGGGGIFYLFLVDAPPDGIVAESGPENMLETMFGLDRCGWNA
jgi:hypothetical protein